MYRSKRCGCSPARRHTRATKTWLIQNTLANSRVLQCVLPSGGRCRVFAKMRASMAGGGGTVGGCPQYLARSPASRAASKRRFQRLM